MSSALSPGAYVRQGGRGGAGGAPPRAVNVQVAVRCRPLNVRERNTGERAVLVCNSEAREVVCSAVGAVGAGKAGAGGPATIGKKTYTYDHVFGPECGQGEVYEGVVEPIVDEVLQGYNCTVFAYGQTGTGKTHTMEGRRDDDVLCMAERRLPENAGIIPRSVKQIFDHLRSITDEHTVRVSHLELYNEQLSDLLGPDVDPAAAADAGLRVYDDQTKGTFVQGLDEVLVRSEEEIFAVLDKSANKRRTAETLMNKYSSRSHSVFSITIHIKESTPDGADLLKVGKLNLVDLAGSENVGRSGAVRGRAREAGNINQSLLTLGRVITALVEKHPHVPYRDSKLTRLLQESLGGRNKTCIIATVTPAGSSTEETHSTLDYAHRAKSIKNRPTVNQMIAKHVLLKEYTEEIAKIKRELEASRTKNGIFLPPDEYERLQATGKQQKEWISALEGRMDESERAAGTLKDKLSRTQDALARTFAELEETHGTLATAQEALAARTRDLAVSTQQRDEAHHLVGAHVSAEVQLHAEGCSLTTTLERAVADVGALHARADARASAEEANTAAVEALRASVATRLCAAESRMSAFREEHAGQLTSCRDRAERLAAVVSRRISDASGALDLLCADVRSMCHKQLAEAETSASGEGAAERVESAGLRKRGESQMQLARSVDAILGAAASEVGTSLDAVLTGVEELHATATASLQGQAAELAAFAAAQAALLERARAQADEQLNSQAQAIAAADAAVVAAVDEQKSAVRVAQQEALAEITGVLSKLVQASDASGESVAAAAKESAETLGSSVAAVRNTFAQTGSDHGTLSKDTLASSQTGLSTATRRGQEALMSVTERAAALGDATATSIASCRKDLATVVQHGQAHAHDLDLHFSSLTAQRAARDARRRTAAAQQDALLQSQAGGATAELRQTAADAIEAARAVGKDLAGAGEASTTFVDELAGQLASGVGAEVAAIRLTVDEDAAAAPPRRSWDYPTSLTVAPDHEALISEFREAGGHAEVPTLDGLPARAQKPVGSAAASDISGHNSDDQGANGDGGSKRVDAGAGVDEAASASLVTANNAAAEREAAEVEAGAAEEVTSNTGAADWAGEEDGPAAVLRDRTNEAASAPTRRSAAKAVGADDAAAVAKRSGLRPMTRRAPRPVRTRQT
jgi:kinesin family member 11